MPDYLFPVNHLGVGFLETFRSLGSRPTTVQWSEIYNALGLRFYSLPMSPPKIMATMDMAAD